MSLKKSVSDGKSAVASAITEKGVSTSSDATFQTIANNISQIPSNDVIFVTGANMNMAQYFPKEVYSTFTSSNFSAIITASASCRYAYAGGSENMYVTAQGVVSYDPTTGIASGSVSGTSSSSGGNSGQTLTASGSVIGMVFHK